MATGNTASIAANRISYVFDLRGPSMAIDTACSSSLVALHQACRSIVSGECTHALAGGVSLHLHPYGFITFSKASMLSRRGRCSVFDAAGDGYVRSEGGGIFVLKDYDLAVADGNPILAVIASTVVNTDGRKSGLTVPSARAQASLMERAYSEAGIDPAAIDYVEAHGTGTPVGDPVETRAIGEAIGKRRPKGTAGAHRLGEEQPGPPRGRFGRGRAGEGALLHPAPHDSGDHRHRDASTRTSTRTSGTWRSSPPTSR